MEKQYRNVLVLSGCQATLQTTGTTMIAVTVVAPPHCRASCDRARHEIRGGVRRRAGFPRFAGSGERDGDGDEDGEGDGRGDGQPARVAPHAQQDGLSAG